MKITQLEYFIKVCEYGSINLAAKKMFVSQPAITTSINALEEELNINLFTRQKGKLLLTKEGDFFLKNIKPIINELDLLKNKMQSFNKAKNLIKIGVPPMIGAFLFTKIYKEFISLYPNVTFEIYEGGSLQMPQYIDNKVTELALTIYNENINAYNHINIYETSLVFIVSRENALASKKEVDINDIKDTPLILMKEGSFQNNYVHNLFDSIQAKPNVILYSSQLQTIKNFVKMNAGGAFIFKDLITKEDDDIVGIKVKGKFDFKICLFWSKNLLLYRGALDFINYCSKLKVK